MSCSIDRGTARLSKPNLSCVGLALTGVGLTVVSRLAVMRKAMRLSPMSEPPRCLLNETVRCDSHGGGCASVWLGVGLRPQPTHMGGYVCLSILLTRLSPCRLNPIRMCYL